MPYKSQQQRKLFYAKAQYSSKWAKMAKEWEEATPKGKKLPKKIKGKVKTGKQLLKKAMKKYV